MVGWKGRVVIVAAVLALAGCGDPPPRQDKKLALPKGESTLDDLIRKSQAAPSTPPVPARLAVTPTALDFPTVAIGGLLSRTVRIGNGGATPARLGQIRIAGQAAVFRLGGSCTPGMELAGGQSCEVEIAFRPNRDGEADAELVVDHDAVGGSLFVPMTATTGPAEPVAAPAPQIAAPNAQASLTFARSRQDGGLVVDGAGADGEAAEGEERRPHNSRSVDYAEAGLPGIVSTFPVARSRVITADRYIPAVLENTINSQLPGRAIAVVERNVYGAEGRTVLIPAGSRIVGHYQSAGKMGDARLDIDWSRILRPDGVSINIDDRTADVMGRTGVPGDLDTRFAEKYGGSLLTSVIAAGGDWALGGTGTVVTSQLGGTTQTLDGKALAANRLGNDLDRLGQRMVEENIDIRPVLTVPQGTRLNVIPAEDIWLRDPNRIQAVTPVKGATGLRTASADGVNQYLPGLVELLAQNPALQRMAPQTSQQILQSNLLQQLREANQPAPAAPAATPAPAAGTQVRP